MDGLLVLNVVPKAKSFFQKLWELVWHSFDQALVLSRLLMLELGVTPLHDFDDEGLRHTSLCSAKTHQWLQAATSDRWQLWQPTSDR